MSPEEKYFCLYFWICRNSLERELARFGPFVFPAVKVRVAFGERPLFKTQVGEMEPAPKKRL